MDQALGALALSPADFWAMTPLELASAMTRLNGVQRPGPPARSTIDELLQRYPDEVIS